MLISHKTIIMTRITAILASALFSLCLQAQTPQDEIRENICLAGSNYLAYPTPQKQLSPAPEGKTPFYISHYGRHGSRYLIDKRDYIQTADILEKAQAEGKLTPLGSDVLQKVKLMSDESAGRYGELTELGALQHRQIAHRMYERFPEVFADSVWVDAKSTVVIRCILSMENELIELKSLNPTLRMKHDASEHDMFYMNHHDQQLVDKRFNDSTRIFLDSWEKENLHPEKVMRRLFNDSTYVEENIDSRRLYKTLFKLANIIQNSEIRHTVSLYDIFDEQDIYSLWLRHNIGWFSEYGSNEMNGGNQPFTQRFLLRQIIHEADSCLALEKPGATLRFGHETMVLPLTCLLDLNGYGKTMRPTDVLANEWVNYRIFPMGCNIQFIFYRESPADSDIWVKVLLNEEEATLPIKPVQGCYYRWKEVRDYYTAKLDAYEME